MLTFDKEKHQYYLDGTPLISVTQLLKKHHLSTDYSAVPEAVLDKKAKRGSYIHEEIEEYIKNNKSGFTSELNDFIDIINAENLTDLISEEMVSNDLVAGTIDLQAKADGKAIIADFKTCAALDKNSVAWQLSIYEALSGKTFDELWCIHFGKVTEVIKLDRKDAQGLLQAEREGRIYEQKALDLSVDKIAEIKRIQTLIAKAKQQEEEATKMMEAINTELMNAMESQGFKSFECAEMKITYIEPTVRETIDSKRLKAEEPAIAKKFAKISTVKPSIRITLR